MKFIKIKKIVPKGSALNSAINQSNEVKNNAANKPAQRKDDFSKAVNQIKKFRR